LKILLLLLSAYTAWAADWDTVRRIPADQKIEITARDGTRTDATFISATSDMLLLREKSGERSLPRIDIRRLRVFDPARRIHRGLLFTGAGAGFGAAAGLAACPSCANEGHGPIYVGPGIAIGAGIGALGFLILSLPNHL